MQQRQRLPAISVLGAKGLPRATTPNFLSHIHIGSNPNLFLSQPKGEVLSQEQGEYLHLLEHQREVLYCLRVCRAVDRVPRLERRLRWQRHFPTPVSTRLPVAVSLVHAPLRLLSLPLTISVGRTGVTSPVIVEIAIARKASKLERPSVLLSMVLPAPTRPTLFPISKYPLSSDWRTCSSRRDLDTVLTNVISCVGTSSLRPIGPSKQRPLLPGIHEHTKTTWAAWMQKLSLVTHLMTFLPNDIFPLPSYENDARHAGGPCMLI